MRFAMRDEPVQTELKGLRRHPVLEVTIACLVVLLVAQALIGALSLSALSRLNLDTTADRVEVAARQMAGGIQNGLRLGKPLGQFFGLNNLLSSGMAGARDARGAAVLLPDGRLVGAQGRPAPDLDALAQALAAPPGSALPDGLSRRAGGAVMSRTDGMISVAVPLADAAGALAGVAVLSVVRDEVTGHRLVADNLKVLFAVTLAVGLGLAAVFKYAIPPARLAQGGRARFVVPLLALLLAQGIYAGYTINVFRSASLQVARDSAGAVAEGLQRDLNRVLGYGIAIDHLRGAEAPFSRLAATFPVIHTIELRDAAGRVLKRADAGGPLPVENPRAKESDEFTISLPLGAAGSEASARGSLVVRLADDVVSAAVRSRVIDAATVAAVALVAAVEILLLLAVLLNRAFSSRGIDVSGQPTSQDDASDIGRIARPVMFGFLFAWALPLSFLPLFARSLPAAGLDLPPNLLLALPISVEMGCGLLTALLAGGLTDRRGWQVPVLAGLVVSCAGLVACAAAASLPWFACARGLVGLGYGLTWMGLQGFVVTRSLPEHRGRNMTGVIAGLFAGHLAGAAVGAMLMEQLGFRAVFVAGAAMLLLPLAGVLVLMRPYMSHGGQCVLGQAHRPLTRDRLGQALRLIFTRDFGLLLLGSVIPFSIAQVGLLSFALPLYLEAQGAAASSVGRVLMIYGVCVIYVGPLMGRLADRSMAKKRWIVMGGLIGSVGMLGLYFNSGLGAAALAVLLLALASCFAGASQSPYMLALPDVQRYGAAGATSMMRAADKLGQMAGPLVVGAMFGAAGMGAGLAMTGLIYLAATLLFLFFAPASARAVSARPAARAASGR